MVKKKKILSIFTSTWRKLTGGKIRGEGSGIQGAGEDLEEK